MLVEGVWNGDWHPVQSKDEQGRFVRQVSSFRNWITPDGAPGPTGTGGFKAEAGRYRLYVALICPWASRTLIARKIKGLDQIIPVTILNPRSTKEGWQFGGYPGAGEDPLHGAKHIHELYTRADPHYTGRATVPVLWDMKQDTMVNNESADILRIFDSAFDGIVTRTPTLRPADLEGQMAPLEQEIYDNLNNGVYKAGFAQTQLAYDEAVAAVFSTLDRLEERLTGDYLFGDRFTETDIRLFVTLIRFDAAYHGAFKCNLRRIADYPRLWAYVQRILALPGVAETVNIDHIKAGYYGINALNPTGIVPAGPDHVTALFTKRR